jgi:hypothetical protein
VTTFLGRRWVRPKGAKKEHLFRADTISEFGRPVCCSPLWYHAVRRDDVMAGTRATEDDVLDAAKCKTCVLEHRKIARMLRTSR